MKMAICVLLLATAATTSVAQITGPEQDCSSAIPVCQSTYVQNTSYTGVGTVQELVGGTCLLSNERNSVWYTFTAQSAGSLAFTINTLNDYDFALYNITGTGCAGVPASTPIRCNYAGTIGATGLLLPAASELPALSGGAPLSLPGVSVTAGGTYALLVTNYTGDQQGYTLTFNGTASIGDGTPPSIASAILDTANCTVLITTSEPIRCASIAPDGSDFLLNVPAGAAINGAAGVGCGAFTNTIRLTYALTTGPEGCGIWNISAKAGTDGNTLIDNCANSLPAGSQVSLTTTAPTASIAFPKNEYCEGEPIIVDGSASSGETVHYWSVTESDANWNLIGTECGQTFAGQAGTKDILQFAQENGCPMRCGHYYSVKLAVRSCCTGTGWKEEAKLIRIQCPPVADAGPDKTVCSCCGAKKLKIGSPPTGGLQYQWNPTSGLDNPTASDPTIDMSAFGDPSNPFPSTYEVTATDSLGCSSRDSVYIKTVCACRPPANVTLATGGICSTTSTLTADCACGNTTPTYLWTPGGATTASIQVPAGSGPYSVTCSNECGATVSQAITSPPASPITGGFPPLSCPNVFTPNGDGINDLWVATDQTLPVGAIPAYNATGYELTVFNRWGNVVAVLVGSTNSGFANQSIPGWNGIATHSVLYNWWQELLGKKDVHAGSPVSEGVYYYVLKLRNCSTGWTPVCIGFTHIFR